MPVLIFLSEAVLISLSGVMAPGPVTAITIGKGNKSPYAGSLIAIGHGIVEIPLMVAVFFGLGQVLDLPYVKEIIAFVGGLFLLVMGVGLLRSVRQEGQDDRGPSEDARSPVVVGVLLSLGNPYFLVWWATVGAALILRSVGFGLLGFLAFALLHWLCDFLWYSFLSVLSFKGGQFFGRKFQRVVFSVCAVLLLFFSARLVLDGVRELFV